MMRRVPLWLTLVPLLVGIAGYYWVWSGWARDFGAVISAWLPGTAVEVTGFPYRLEADVAQPQLSGGDVVRLTATASSAAINRGPWQPELTIVSTTEPRFAAVVGPGVGASVAGKTGLTSIHMAGGQLARLSSVVEAARARLGFTSAVLAADTLELHLRERHDAPPPKTSPVGAVRGQLVLLGQRLRIDNGDALTFAADIAVTGAGRLLGYDSWATTGTIEIGRASLADAHGEIASLTATIVPQGRTGLRFAGTVETICPLNVAAAFAGTVAVPEARLRTPLRLSFAGVAGAVRLDGLPADLATRPTRAQLPPCPVLRNRR